MSRNQITPSAAEAIRNLIRPVILTTTSKVEKSNKPQRTGGKTPGHGPLSNNGGAREGAGRPAGGSEGQRRARKLLIETHVEEKITVTVKDPKTGQPITIEKPRIVVAMEKLFQLGTKGDGDAAALDKWMNRAVGKAVQPIVGDEDEPPVQVDLGVGRIIDKVYGNTQLNKGSRT